MSEPPENNTQPSDEDELLNQAELDALVAAQSGTSDDSVAPTESSPPEQSEEAAPDQSEPDASVAAQQSGQVVEPPPPEEGAGPDGDAASSLPDQSESEELAAAHQSEEDVEPPSAPLPSGGAEGETLLDQSQLDALLAKASAEQEGPEDDTAPPSAVLDKGDLTTLADQIKDEREGPSPDEDAPIRETDDSSPLLTQSELDTLEAQRAAALAEMPDDDDEPREVAILSEDELDELLSSTDADKALDDSDLDAVVVDAAASQADMDTVLPDEEAEPGDVSQVDVDSLIAQVTAETAPEQEEAPGPADQGEADVLPAPQPDEEPVPPLREEVEAVGSENLAAAAVESQENILPQDLLDSLVAEGQADNETEAVPAEPPGSVPSPEELAAALPFDEQPPEIAGEPEDVLPVKRRFRKPFLPGIAGWLREKGAVKVAVSLAAGLVTSVSTFLFLSSHSVREADLQILGVAARDDLASALEAAQEFVDFGRYQEAIDALSPPIARAPITHPLLADAEYLRLRALYSALPETLSESEVEKLAAAVDDVVRRHPLHPQTSEALYWKARAYERGGMPLAAASAYKRLLSSFSDAPRQDAILMAAAGLALDLDRPQDAAQYAERLLTDFPASSSAGRAQILLGNALIAQGQRDRARDLFARLALSHPDTALGAQAFARLGEIALEDGNVDQAIDLLERRRESATTTLGSDEVYLLLAKAYRAAGRALEAEQVLRDLIAFFPETKATPAAYVELTQVLDLVGKRSEAMRLAMQAGQRFPNNATVMRNLAAFLDLSGNELGAAEALMAVDAAGAKDPEVLLEAARYFRNADELDRALAAYERLNLRYPTSPQAMQARIETSEVYYDQGHIRKALDALEDLAMLSRGKPQQLTVLVALGGIYDKLGLPTLTTQTFEQIASMSAEPALLARSAMALFDGGAWEEGLSVAQRVDTSKLDDQTAYAFLNQHGRALLRGDAARGLEVLERAYELFPDLRTPQSDLALFNAYLASDRTARARQMVMQLDAHVRTNPGDAPFLERAALDWGDYLFERRDFRAALEAYALVDKIPIGSADAAHWARFQRASALLHLEDFAASLALLDEIADSDSPWAEQSRLKAAYVRMEQRLRGLSTSS